MNRSVIGTIALFGLLILGTIYSRSTASQETAPAGAAPLAAPNGKEADEAQKAILVNVRSYMEAFNRRDAAAILALFAANCTITEFDGTKVNGLKEFEAELKETFRDEPKTQISVDVDALRFVTPDVATETGSVTYYPDGKTAASKADYEVTHVRTNGKWLMNHVRVFDRTVISPYDRLRELEWLVGDWFSEGDGSILETSYRWDANKAFLLQQFTLRVNDQKALTGTQRIGWDPLSKQIKSWVFDVEGGQGESLWNKLDDRWVVKVKGVRLDGKVVTATNSIQPLGKDRFRYESADRIVGEQPSPNFTTIGVRRPPAPTK